MREYERMLDQMFEKERKFSMERPLDFTLGHGYADKERHLYLKSRVIRDKGKWKEEEFDNWHKKMRE